MSLSNKLSDKFPNSFQFKASFSHCISFEMLRNDVEGIKRDLTEMMRHSSQFFTDSPVVIDLDKMKTMGAIDFISLKQILLSFSIVPIGIRGGHQEHQRAALQAGLPLIRVGKASPPEVKNATPTTSPIAKLITQPVRSGMQIIAKSGDLIVTSQVSPGAELMADGNIHVYGVLRGRAVAGMHGNQEARIFCQSLEADLVAIAGIYLMRDEIELPKEQNGPIQIYLQREKLKIEKI